jgi:ketosteroid isomerase-like protein
MKTVGSVLFMAILAIGMSPARGEDDKSDAASTLKALDAKLTDAFKAGDFEMLGKYFADDYILVDPRGGLHSKKQHLKYLTDGTAKFKELNETDVNVKVFGDTAVVTGLLQVTGTVEGKEISPEYRWTRVYNKSGDMWQCVLEQHTYVHPKGGS